MNRVLIIGAGIIGLSIARELRKRGIRDVTIVEKGDAGLESSYAAGGMLAVHAETDSAGSFFDLCTESLQLYPDFAGELFDETGIDVELDREGTLYLAFTPHDQLEIDKRFAWQTTAGFAVERLSSIEIKKLEPFVSPDVTGGLFFANDWQVENRKLLRALIRFAELNDVEIRQNERVTGICKSGNTVTAISTDKAELHADAVVITAGAWSSLISLPGVRIPPVKPVRGQMISFRTAQRLFSKVIYSPRGYLIPRMDGRILVGATSEDAGFEKPVTDAADEFLRETALEIAPGLVNLEIEDHWTGLRPYSPDALPVLGEAAPNPHFATAHYRNGILLAPLTARIIADSIVNNSQSRYLETFSPQRFNAFGQQS